MASSSRIAIVPSSQQQIAGASGLPTPPWVQFFNALVQKPGSIASVTVTASPFTYMASGFGTLRISGGTVASITLTRSGTSVSFGITASVPVANGDTVTFIYTVVPTVNFIPG